MNWGAIDAEHAGDHHGAHREKAEVRNQRLEADHMTTVIQAEALGKRYRRGVPVHKETLKEVFGSFTRAPLTALRRPSYDTFWALRDVSFEIKQGDIVGVIGRNGAGKSTLLKILSRITRPTTGWAEIRGRVRSLLEVGTGFHAELSGRENTYFSGSIMGMSKREVDRKFDAIVAFAEIDKFIDTPVKHYSSGMYVRLAFAVAAHLEPEILLVDEVLAVGDVQFQKKCLGKMREVGVGGRTIIFVSHNLNAVSALCRSAILLADGELVHFSDNVQEALRLYLGPAISTHTVGLSGHPGRVSDRAAFEEIAVHDENNGPSHRLLPGAAVTIQLKVRPLDRITSPKVTIGVTNARGERVFAVGTHIGGTEIPSIEGPSTIHVRFIVPPLVPGQYTLDIGLYDTKGNPLDEIYGAVALELLKDERFTMVDKYTPHTGNIMVRSECRCTLDADPNSSELISTGGADRDSSPPRSNS
jgi:lipopolysaccharide transport system ATP-binding protein